MKGAALQPEEGLELAHHLAPGGLGVEGLPEQAPEGAMAGVVAVAAVFFRGGFGEEFRRQPAAKALLQFAESVGADLPDGLGGAGTHGVEAGGPSSEEGGIFHRAVYIPPY